MDSEEKAGEKNIGWTEADWATAAQTTGVTPMQLTFVRAKLKGANNTQAAREAGYAGDDDSLRSTGYRVSRSGSVQALIRLAEAGGAGIPDSILTGEESKQILSRIARGTDKSIAIRAAEVLHRIDKDDREAREKEPTDPRKLLDEIAHIDPVYAARLATREGITDWNTDWLDSLPRCPQCGQHIRPESEDDLPAQPKPNGVAAEPRTEAAA